MTFFPAAMAAPNSYGWLMLLGIAASAVIWSRRARRDSRLVLIYTGALVGSLLGAKLAYLIAEGWFDFGKPDSWARLATGKSILGALLGGYWAVETVKSRIGYLEPTGDLFALTTPIGVIIGRLGCWMHGCCLGHRCSPSWFSVRDGEGIHRWPSVPLEIGFNLAMLLVFVLLRWRRMATYQHFHLYLIAYGIFRAWHEVVRDTPRWVGPVSGYQLISMGLVAFGIMAFRRRSRYLARQMNHGPVARA